MKKVIVRAPVRADLAGGTLDLWPLYLFHPGSRTVNVAISFHAESEVVETRDEAIEIHLTDQDYKQRYASIHELGADPKASLIHRALEHFHLTGIKITTRTDAPRGSGLGGSSALTITLVRALSEIAGNPIEGDDLIALVRDLETRLIRVPAGIQDYYPPVYGGLLAIHLNPGLVVRHQIALPVERLAEHMLLHYTGVSHFSGTNNWDIYKRQIDGKKKVHKGLDKIAESAIEMEKALESGDLEAAGVALGHEWENRKALIEGISTPEIESAITAATGAGASSSCRPTGKRRCDPLFQPWPGKSSTPIPSRTASRSSAAMMRNKPAGLASPCAVPPPSNSSMSSGAAEPTARISSPRRSSRRRSREAACMLRP